MQTAYSTYLVSTDNGPYGPKRISMAIPEPSLTKRKINS